MVITQAHAEQLIARGDAQAEGIMYDDRMRCSYRIITRYDVQRTDHYLVGEGDLRPA